jgi:hypothetical protein
MDVSVCMCTSVCVVSGPVSALSVSEPLNVHCSCVLSFSVPLSVHCSCVLSVCVCVLNVPVFSVPLPLSVECFCGSESF